MIKQTQSQFHAAEIAVQEHVGVAELVAEYSEGFIRPAMPTQHRDFFNELPFVILGLIDTHGYPWAIPLFGETGFIHSPDDTSLDLQSLPDLTHALDLDFTSGQKIGMLGIQLNTRRRNRMNGVISEIRDNGFSIQVEQSFGNCPQYIQTRELVWHQQEASHADFSDIEIENVLDTSVSAFIEKADTFFIASRTKKFSTDTRSGIDASHRGGKPGFVKVEGNSLYFPDFSGNRFFNTLGNIYSDGRVGLFFPNFQTGDAVFIAGNARIHWQHDALTSFEGAERIIEIQAKKVSYIKDYMPLRGQLVEQSPVLEQTGTWEELETEKSAYQSFKIVDKHQESETITSFYLAPEKGFLQNYTPGQYLPIELTLPDRERSIKRSYTLSQAPRLDNYRISVKREPEGLASKSLHDLFEIGDTVKVGKPTGQFVLQQNEHVRVLISAGVGITPMIAMLEGAVKEFENGAKPRPLWFIHATQNSSTQAFRNYLIQLTQRYSWLHVHTVFSQALPTDEIGRTHQTEGRLSIDTLKSILPFDQYDFYLCGSEGFMRSLYTGLVKTGVQKAQIYYEFFGEGQIDDTTENQDIVVASKAQVTFFTGSEEADVSGEWTPEEGSLLDFAEKQGLEPQYSCRSGNCGSCACKLHSGEVVYPGKTGYVPSRGEVLLCQARPAEGSTQLVIDI